LREQVKRKRGDADVVEISLERAEDVDDFCAFLRAVNTTVTSRHGTTVDAHVPNASSELHERRELKGYVVTWNALNPGRTATVID
jgi:hypothetical protein